MHGHQKGWYSLSSTGPQGNVETFGYSHIWSFFSNQEFFAKGNSKLVMLVSIEVLFNESISF